jgi:hypothetical protein
MEKNEQGDPSASLDMVTIFRSAGAAAEFEALEIQALLESNDIDTVLIGDSRFPNFPEEIRVAKEDAERALALVAEAQKNGPQAADEAEAAGEQSQN